MPKQNSANTQLSINVYSTAEPDSMNVPELKPSNKLPNFDASDINPGLAEPRSDWLKSRSGWDLLFSMAMVKCFTVALSII